MLYENIVMEFVLEKCTNEAINQSKITNYNGIEKPNGQPSETIKMTPTGSGNFAVA